MSSAAAPTLIREAVSYFARAIITRVYGSTEVPLATVGVTDPGDVIHAAETDGRPGIAEVILADEGEIAAAMQKSGVHLAPEQIDLLLDGVLSGDLVRLVAVFNSAMSFGESDVPRAS